MILTKVLRIQSKRVIGLVLDKFPSNSFGFGIGKMVALRQLLGIILCCKMKLNSWRTNCKNLSGRCLIISYEILEGPDAFFNGSCLITSFNWLIVTLSMSDSCNLRSSGLSFR